MDYTFRDSKLYYDSAQIYEAPTDITKLFNLTNDGRIFIIYRGRNLLPDDYHDITNPMLKDKELQKLINQNVLCLDKEGNVIWRIESTFDYPIDHTHLFKEDGSFWAYRRDAREFKFDPDNGKILDWRFGI